MNIKRATAALTRLIALLVCVASASASPAPHASFTVSPTQVFLNPITTSAVLTLRNESGDALRFQLTVFKWAQSPTGEMLLTPTEDIVFFPKLVELAAHQERQVRVGSAGAYGVSEQTYRIFVEELPAAKTGEGVPAGVQMRTRMGIPIFMQPSKATSGANLSDPATSHAKVTLKIENRGSVHVVADAVQLRGTAAGGAVVFTKVVNGWYILAGGTQTFEFALTDAECKGTASFQAEAKVGEATLHSQGPLDQAGCAGRRE